MSAPDQSRTTPQPKYQLPDDLQAQLSALLSKIQRVVIKVGSSLLVDRASQELNQSWLNALAIEIAELKDSGCAVIVVSSGAVALGRRTLGSTRTPVTLAERQSAAAVGQVALANAWRDALAPHSITTAQILLSPEDTETRRRHLNARATMSELLKLGVVPIVNENDTVATAELRFGDNDRLAARVAAMMGAELLVLLSDIDGLYTANPRADERAEHLAVIEALTPEVVSMAGPPNEAYASGGMVTKLEAARIATDAGCQMLICDGRAPSPLTRVREGERFTLFKAVHDPQTARERWIAGALTPKGAVRIDDGAVEATRTGRSLLPVGALSVSGEFARGDLIQVESASGEVLGHGLTSYSSDDASRICGLKSAEIADALGHHPHDELIHADDLVMRRVFTD